jgi:cell division protein FtsW (lipid II flippase)
MNGKALTRPRWLRLQPLNISPWLTTYIFAAFALYLLTLFAPAWKGTPSLSQLIERVGEEQTSGKLYWQQAVFAAPVWIVFLWFTYYCGSKRVRDSDKFLVFLMFCVAALGLVMISLRHFFAHA